MKKLLLTLALGMVAVFGFSQVRWDVKFGMNFSNQTKSDDAKALPGFTMGVGADYAFNENWSFQPGLMFTSKGYKVKESGEKFTARPIYLDIPILAAYKFDIADNTKFVINAGPYLAIGLGGKSKWHVDGANGSKLFDSDEGDWKRFDLGLQWGVGVELGEHYLVNFTAQHGFITPYDFGDNYDGDKPKNMSFAIGVGYRF
ncbi:porin family protein [Bacteroides gallinaceum]|uniref:porin family protein n=1 Tax=Bacteroides gallinaceum TaxID=1462571 RepID=UPI0025A335B1|nr:porin family protein [Bacteroides gallinaceum]MDM8209000.1 porin family protein [Bacteroides gallinaceum]